MLIAQITDLHLGPPDQGDASTTVADPIVNARATLEAVAGLVMRPDLVVLTGDLADKGEIEAYAWLDQELARHGIPAYVIPGNHDLRTPMRAAFGHHGYLPEDGYMQYVVETEGARLIALDTVIEHETRGLVCAERRAWLAERLAEDRVTPTLIMMHHQPFHTGGPFDEIGIEGREDLEEVIAAAPNVIRIICGHMHRDIRASWAGTTVSVCPSSAFQFDLNHADPTTFRVRAEPPGYHLHDWNEATGLVTYTGTVGEFPVIKERARP